MRKSRVNIILLVRDNGFTHVIEMFTHETRYGIIVLKMLLLGHTDAERKQRLDIRGCERGAREWERAEPEVRRVSHLAAK